MSFVVTLHLEFFASSCGRVQTENGKSHVRGKEREEGRSRECRVALLYTRLLAGQTRPIFNSVIVKEVCACESPEEYAPKSARAMNKSRGQRGTTYGDGAYLKIESGRKRDGKGRAENARIVRVSLY